MQPILWAIYELSVKVKGAGTVPLLAKVPVEMLRNWLPNLVIIAIRQGKASFIDPVQRLI
jgi:hypothetical protein